MLNIFFDILVWGFKLFKGSRFIIKLLRYGTLSFLNLFYIMFHYTFNGAIIPFIHHHVIDILRVNVHQHTHK